MLNLFQHLILINVSITIMTEKEHNYAGFWIRFLAAFIDGALLFPYIMFVVIMNSISYPVESVQIAIATEIQGLLITVLYIAYEIIMFAEYKGQTFGYRMTGIRLVMEDGSDITYGKALVRSIATYASFPIFLLGYLWIIWDKKKQAWHDKIAQTLVVKA